MRTSRLYVSMYDTLHDRFCKGHISYRDPRRARLVLPMTSRRSVMFITSICLPPPKGEYKYHTFDTFLSLLSPSSLFINIYCTWDVSHLMILVFPIRLPVAENPSCREPGGRLTTDLARWEGIGSSGAAAAWHMPARQISRRLHMSTGMGGEPILEARTNHNEWISQKRRETEFRRREALTSSSR